MAFALNPDEEQIKAKSVRRNVVLTAAVAGFSGLLFGYDAGIIATAMLFIRGDFDLSSLEQGIVISSVPIGAAIGALAASRLADTAGRRVTIISAAAVFIAGAALSAAAPDAVVLTVARLGIGVAIGFASAAAPVYIAEMAPPEVRGRLVTFFQLAVTVGILSAYLVGWAFEPIDGWRWMMGVGIVPAVFLGIGMLRMPRSPRWLVMVGREDDARATLGRIRVSDAAVDEEIDEIQRAVAEERGGGWSELREPVVRAALLVGVGLMIFSQITGINTVIYYAPTIVQFTGIDSASAAILAAVGVGVVNVALTIVAIRVLDRVGRRPLLLGGSAVMALALFTLGLAFLGSGEDTFSSVLALSSLMIYVGAYAVSLGPIFWLINSEIFPQRVRGKAVSIGTTTNWIANFIVALTFLLLIDALGRTGAFWLYSAITVCTLIFCWRLVPETKGRSLEEITEEFRRRVGVREQR